MDRHYSQSGSPNGGSSSSPSSHAIWITMVFRADKNPHQRGSRRGSRPRREVIGGSFRGAGGRQLMPLPGREPSGQDDDQVPGDADYLDSETYDTEARRSGGSRHP